MNRRFSATASSERLVHSRRRRCRTSICCSPGSRSGRRRCTGSPIVLGGGYLSRVLHPWVGLVFAAAVAWMFVHVARATCASPTATARGARRSATTCATKTMRVPAAGRFNYGQKMLFWVMAWGGAGAARLRHRACGSSRRCPGDAARAAVRRDAGPRGRGARDHRRVHRARLHGRRRRARRAARDHPRRRQRRVGAAPSSPSGCRN